MEVAFSDLDERQAQAVAAEMIARAHELANRPEHECDVDVSVQLSASGGEALLDGSVEQPVLSPVAAPGDAQGVPTDGHLAPRADAGQRPTTR